MQAIRIDCAGVGTEEEFWQRYVDAAKPAQADLFGRNLDAFWDAIEGGGPGCPGGVELVFSNSEALASLQLHDGRSFLDMLKEIAAAATQIKALRDLKKAYHREMAERLVAAGFRKTTNFKPYKLLKLEKEVGSNTAVWVIPSGVCKYGGVYLDAIFWAINPMLQSRLESMGLDCMPICYGIWTSLRA